MIELGMIDLVGALALLLLVLGVVGSVVPMLPGPLLSLAGLGLYWWHTGFTSPGELFMAGAVAVLLLAIVLDYAGGAISTKAGGASLEASVAAAVAGFVLFFVAGPVGVILGVAGAVFLVEFARENDAERSARAALYATVGLLASSIIQFVLTASVLIAFVLVLVL